MANYSGSRSNAYINSKVIEEHGNQADMDKRMQDANDEIIGIDNFSLKAGKSEHNHATKRHFK